MASELEEDQPLLPENQAFPANYGTIIEQYKNIIDRSEQEQTWGEKLRWWWNYTRHSHVLSDTTDAKRSQGAESKNIASSGEDPHAFASFIHRLARIHPAAVRTLNNPELTKAQFIQTCVASFETIRTSYSASLKKQVEDNYYSIIAKRFPDNSLLRAHYNSLLRKGASILYNKEHSPTLATSLEVSAPHFALLSHTILKIRAKLRSEQEECNKELARLAESINYFSYSFGFGKKIRELTADQKKAAEISEVYYKLCGERDEQISEIYSPTECEKATKKLRQKSFWRAFTAIILAAFEGVGFGFLFSLGLSGPTVWMVSFFAALLGLVINYKLILYFSSGHRTQNGYSALTAEDAEDNQSQQALNEAAEALNQRNWKKMWRIVAFVFAGFVGIGEGGVVFFSIKALCDSAMLGWIAGISVGLAGLVVNYYLTKDDMMGVFERAFFSNLDEDEKGKKISVGQKVSLLIAFGIALCSGVAYAGVSAYCNYTLGLEPLLGTTHLAMGLAAVPVLFTAVGMFAIFYKIMADFIVNWPARKASIQDWWHENITLPRQASTKEQKNFFAYKQIFKLFTSFFLSTAIAAVGYFLFGGSVQTLFDNLNMSSIMMLAIIIAATNAFTTFIFGIKNGNQILLSYGDDGLANLDANNSGSQEKTAQPSNVLEDFHASISNIMRKFFTFLVVLNTAGINVLFWSSSKKIGHNVANFSGSHDTITKALISTPTIVVAQASAAFNSAPGNENAGDATIKEDNAAKRTGFFSIDRSRSVSRAAPASPLPGPDLDDLMADSTAEAEKAAEEGRATRALLRKKQH